MDLQLFKDALDDLGIRYKDSGVSLVIQDCPACGSRKFKVRFRVRGVSDAEPFYGRCQRGSCEEGYSSIKYLLMVGMSRDKVLALHGLDPVQNYKSIFEPRTQNGNICTQNGNVAPAVVDVSKFIKISAWLDHPASQYAIMRGVTEKHFNNIVIDPNANAVVFLIRDENQKVIGYQKRLVRPTNPHMKTITSEGFSRSSHILTFPNDGDLLICEGPFTALSGWHYGFYSVCTLGSFMSAEQFQKILKLSKELKKSIGLALENDEAGIKSFNSLRGRLYWEDIPMFKVLPKIGKDLNDAWAKSAGFEKILDDEGWCGPAIPAINFLG